MTVTDDVTLCDAAGCFERSCARAWLACRVAVSAAAAATTAAAATAAAAAAAAAAAGQRLTRCSAWCSADTCDVSFVATQWR